MWHTASLIGLAALLAFPESPAAQSLSLDERLRLLQSAYKDNIAGIEANRLRMSDGREITIDDGRQKSFDQKLADGDVEDMLSQIYPVLGCEKNGDPPVEFDPGRIRSEKFFASVYGETRDAVARQLVKVRWFGQEMTVSSRFDIPARLAAVERELSPDLAELEDYLIPMAGAFVWRPIAGTSRLSTHSFGIAIDISTKKTEYWRWAKTNPGEPLAARQVLPSKIVAAFERQGFVWGGKWYHFDTMHFEYRPELIAIGMRAKESGCLR